MGLAEQGAEGENDLGKPEAVEAQDNTLLRRAGQQCGNASGELPPAESQGLLSAPCDRGKVLAPLLQLQSPSHPPTCLPGLFHGA